MNSKYFIRPFELFFIILNISTYKIFTGYASVLPKTCGSSAPLSALLSGGFVWLIIWGLLSFYNQKNADTIIDVAPKQIRIPLFIILALSLIFSAISTLRLTVELIKSVSFPTAPLSFIGLIVISCVVICCAQGFDAIARLHSIIIPILFVLTLPVLLCAIPNGIIANLFPYSGYGISQTFKGALNSTGLYSDIIILFLIMPFCKKDSHYKKTVLLALATGILFNTSVITVFTMLTPYSVSQTVLHPVLQLVKLFSAGRFFQRVDGYFMYAVSGCGILSLALIFFSLSYSAGQLFNLPKTRPVAYPLGLICLFSALLISNRESAFNIIESGLGIILAISIFAIGIILFSNTPRRKKQ